MELFGAATIKIMFANIIVNIWNNVEPKEKENFFCQLMSSWKEVVILVILIACPDGEDYPTFRQRLKGVEFHKHFVATPKQKIIRTLTLI